LYCENGGDYAIIHLPVQVKKKKSPFFLCCLCDSERDFSRVVFFQNTYNPEEECEKQELNLRTPAGTDLESASVGHLDILAWLYYWLCEG
jgi:hypothetical protein